MRGDERVQGAYLLTSWLRINHLEQQKSIQALGAIGLLSGLTAIVAVSAVGDTFGLPGTGAYRIYERFNRLMAVLLTLEGSAVLAFYLRRRATLGRVGGAAIVLILIAWLGMALATAAEFWLFTDLPYGANNARGVAFSAFSLSGLIGGLVLLALAVWIVARRRLPRIYGLIFMLYLPLDIALFVSGGSIFLAPALAAIALGAMIMWGERPSTRGDPRPNSAK